MNTHYTETAMVTTESISQRMIFDECYTGSHHRNENFFVIQKNSGSFVEDSTKEYEEHNGYSDNLHFELWSLPFFVDFIIENHHHYVKKQLPLIAELIDYVTKKHSKTFPALFDIQKLFLSFSDSFYKHIFRKEEELFAYIKKIHRLAEEGKQMSAPYFGNIVELENQLSVEHNAVENDLLKLRQITNNFVPPDSSCTNHKRIYKLLKALCYDTRQHIYLENNLVFPEAIELEKKVLKTETVISF